MHYRVGILAVQGAVKEHIDVVNRTLEGMGLEGEGTPVRRKKHLEDVDALIIPGGESTTISKLLVKFDLRSPVIRRAEDGMPIMGTCAGCILLAREGDDSVQRTGTRLLGLMDMAVDRNAFGRQRESFEMDLEVDGFGAPFHAVFIRAPAITEVWGECEPMARHGEKVLAARQGHLTALTFHPELTDDLRFHEMFIKTI